MCVRISVHVVYGAYIVHQRWVCFFFGFESEWQAAGGRGIYNRYSTVKALRALRKSTETPRQDTTIQRPATTEVRRTPVLIYVSYLCSVLRGIIGGLKRGIRKVLDKDTIPRGPL